MVQSQKVKPFERIAPLLPASTCSLLRLRLAGTCSAEDCTTEGELPFALSYATSLTLANTYISSRSLSDLRRTELASLLLALS